MRIYMASFYQYRTGPKSVHTRIVDANWQYPWILESFWSLNKRMQESVRDDKRTVFMDSGAYSAFNIGAKIDLRDYARFLCTNRDLYHVASNLDIVGEGHEQENYDNFKTLENLAGKDVVCPVHHVRDADVWLARYLGEGYQHIFLGGMVPESIPVLREWLDRMWSNYLCNSDGTAKVKVHGFGLTTDELMFRYPWHSVDSTSWIVTSGFGAAHMDFPQGDRIVRRKVVFSEHHSGRYDLDSWHYWSLDEKVQSIIKQRLIELEAERTWSIEEGLVEDFEAVTGVPLAYTPEAFTKSYGLRRVFNMDYYLRVSKLAVSRFTKMQEMLF